MRTIKISNYDDKGLAIFGESIHEVFTNKDEVLSGGVVTFHWWKLDNTWDRSVGSIDLTPGLGSQIFIPHSLADGQTYAAANLGAGLLNYADALGATLPTTNWSVLFWFKTESVSGFTILTDLGAIPGLKISKVGSNMVFNINNGQEQFLVPISSGWNHYAFCVTISGKRRVYKNAIYQTGSILTHVNWSSANIRIGNNNEGVFSVDSVRIMGGLTDGNVLNIYNSEYLPETTTTSAPTTTISPTTTLIPPSTTPVPRIEENKIAYCYRLILPMPNCIISDRMRLNAGVLE